MTSTTSLLILLSMVFCHLIDDYKIQGILADMKQREWWKRNAPDRLYKYDYIVALIEHSFSWTFSIHLPIIIYGIISHIVIPTPALIVTFVFSMVGHAVTDDLKANKKYINLIIDQSIHLVQIVTIWCWYLILFKGIEV